MNRFLFATAVLAVPAAHAAAASLAYEPFDYTAAQRVLGQSNSNTGTSWLLAAASGAAGDTTAINVATGSLTGPSGLPAPIGNSATINGVGNLSGAANRLAFDSAGTSVTSGSVYYSFDLRIDSLEGSNNAGGGFFIGLNNTGNAATTTNPSAVAARVLARIDPNDPNPTSPTTYNLGIARNRATTAADIPWSGPLNLGDTLFIVASVEIVDGLQNDVSRLWIDPTGDSAPATLTDATTGTGTDIGLASIILRQSPAPFLTLDELRIGTEWADVAPVPEPTGIALGGIVAAGLLARRRRA